MKHACRKIAPTTWRRRLLAMTELLHNASVITDPNTLARLDAEVARRKANPETVRITYDLS